MNFADIPEDKYPVLARYELDSYYIVYKHENSLIDVNPTDCSYDTINDIGYWNIDEPSLQFICYMDELDTILRNALPEQFI